ncbi:MAG TPA: hypothetical protein VGS21_04740 [Acidimicrobiales bacterium]|nr:hypothetical protein [Acidimicrobiales bacterium]
MGFFDSDGGILLDLLFAVVVLFLPAVAGLAFAASRGIASRPIQAIFAISTPCVLAYGAGGFYLFNPGVGRGVTIGAYAVVVVGGGLVAVRHWTVVSESLRWWAAPALTTVAAAAFSLGLGFLHGAFAHPLHLAEGRYIHRLANDNVLPARFAAQLLASARPLPHKLYSTAPWLASDRPPLQTAVYVMARSVFGGADPVGQGYEAMGVLLQSLWAPALWCLLWAAGLSRKIIAGTLVSVVLTGFVIFNSFYVWPKLFPGALLVLVAAVIFDDGWRELRAGAWAGIACGTAAGLALLGHTGSALALIPMVVLLVAVPAWRPRWRAAIPAVAAVVVLATPWTLYQRYVDPPGTNLLKLQLAGPQYLAPNVAVTTAVARAYWDNSIGTTIGNKASNFAESFDHEEVAVSNFGELVGHLFTSSSGWSGPLASAALVERNLTYLYLLPALGFFAVGPLAWLFAYFARRRRAGRPQRRLGLPGDAQRIRLAGRLWVFVLLSLVVWALVLFPVGSETVEQGSYAVELLAFGAAVISLRLVSKWAAAAVMLLQAVFGVVVYALVNPTVPGVPPLPTGIDWWMAIVMVAGLVAVAGLPLLAPRSRGG